MKSTKRSFITLVSAFVAVCAWAQGPNGSGTYYAKADGKKGSSLKTALAGIIGNPSVTSYNGLLAAYESTDKRSDGKVWDMYSCTTNFSFSQNTGNYKKEGDMYNREHSFPKSWFGGKVSPMYSDIVHVVPCDGYVNNRRGNNPFGETNGEDYQSDKGFSKLGKSTFPGYSGTVFEPNDEYKGDFARIYFYMVTCYESRVTGWKSEMLDGSKYPAFTNWAKDMLLKWAKEDPVSQKEIDRNNAAYKIQKNRNPFVDYPGLEQYVWGDKTSVAFSYDNYDQPTIIELPTEEPVLFVDVYTISGTKIRSKAARQTATDGLQHGIYIIDGKKVIK